MLRLLFVSLANSSFNAFWELSLKVPEAPAYSMYIDPGTVSFRSVLCQASMARNGTPSSVPRFSADSNSPVPMTRPPGMLSGVLVPTAVALLSVACGSTLKSDHSSAGLT